MEKIFAVLLILGTVFFFAPNQANASWWYDFTHSGSDNDSGPVSCWSCGGSGNCQTCGGSGTVEAYDYENESCYEESCSDCGGSGNCSGCGGSGYQ